MWARPLKFSMPLFLHLFHGDDDNPICWGGGEYEDSPEFMGGPSTVLGTHELAIPTGDGKGENRSKPLGAGSCPQEPLRALTSVGRKS